MFNGVITHSIPAPGTFIRDLAFDSENGTLWCAGQADSTIFQVDPATGDVISSFASPGLNPGGIDFLSERQLSDAFNGQFTQNGGVILHTDWAANDFYILDREGNILQTWSTIGTLSTPIALAYLGGGVVMTVDGSTETNPVQMYNFIDRKSVKTATLNARRGAYFDGNAFITASIVNNNIVAFRIPIQTTPLWAKSNPQPGGIQGLTGDGTHLWLVDNNSNLLNQVS